MRIAALSAVGARNLEPLHLVPGPRFNVFAGDNGQGKTNLLEAVYVLAALRSFRTTRLADIIRRDRPATVPPDPSKPGRDAPRATLAARVVKDDLERKYQVVVEPGHRSVTLDGKAPRPLSRYFGGFNVVLFAPEDLQIARGAPAERRRFLDRSVFSWMPSYLEQFQAYEKVLKSRNAVLRNADGDRNAEALLAVYDEQLAPLAVVIAKTRRALLDEISPRFAVAFEAITRTGVPVALDHVTAPELAAGDAAAVLAGLVRDRRKDLARGSTSLGPHRDDLVFKFSDEHAANFASQGQLRALVLAWKTAELDLLREHHGDPPILLLDDVSSELDESRNLYLFEYLAQRELQCFITTTHFRHVRLTRERVDHEVRNGVISLVK